MPAAPTMSDRSVKTLLAKSPGSVGSSVVEGTFMRYLLLFCWAILKAIYQD
jgi:hypothetical protein